MGQLLMGITTLIGIGEGEGEGEGAGVEPLELKFDMADDITM